MGEQLALVVGGQLLARVVVRGRLDLRLGVGDGQGFAAVLGLGQRHQRHVVAEQAALDPGPLRPAGLVVLIDVVDRPQLLAAGSDDGRARQGGGIGDGHGVLVGPKSGRVGIDPAPGVTPG